MVLGGTLFFRQPAYHAIGISKFTAGPLSITILQHPGHDGGDFFLKSRGWYPARMFCFHFVGTIVDDVAIAIGHSLITAVGSGLMPCWQMCHRPSSYRIT